MSGENEMYAGSLKAIGYALFALIDEILHADLFEFVLGRFEWRARFCGWAHRYDG